MNHIPCQSFISIFISVQMARIFIFHLNFSECSFLHFRSAFSILCFPFSVVSFGLSIILHRLSSLVANTYRHSFNIARNHDTNTLTKRLFFTFSCISIANDSQAIQHDNIYFLGFCFDIIFCFFTLIRCYFV